MYQLTNEKLEVLHFLIAPCERFPNNSKLPLIIYRQFFDIGKDDDGEKLIRETFEGQGWGNAWCDGIYDYHHYHSTAHEVLGVASGSAVVNFGGTGGMVLDLAPGDIILIPAGVAHKCLKHDERFRCVGAYPRHQNYDMNYGKDAERPTTDLNISHVPLPQTDPVFGRNGPMFQFWRK